MRVPAVLFLVLSWGVFVPLAHSLSFEPGQGWFDFLPQAGLGAIGGWTALLVYVVLLGSALVPAVAVRGLGTHTALTPGSAGAHRRRAVFEPVAIMSKSNVPVADRRREHA